VKKHFIIISTFYVYLFIRVQRVVITVVIVGLTRLPSNCNLRRPFIKYNRQQILLAPILAVEMAELSILYLVRCKYTVTSYV
jgi:hypothetical protein